MDLQTIFARLKTIGDNFTAGQIVSLVVSFVLVVGVVGGSAMWLNTPTYALLFADMDEDAAGQVVTRLKSMKVQYSLDEGGRAIRVPSSRVDELRLELTAQGLPSSGRVGFEIFDRTAFGATEFLEKVNYRRALEGEIARTITTIAEVGGARVHIAMGKDSLFGEPRPAKASVVLKLRDSRGLPASAVAGISNLVAASVEGLRPEAVVILDSMGRPLSKPSDGDDEVGGAQQMERQQRLEQDMSTRLITLLEPVVGEGRVRVNVALKLNPKSRELTEERWDPNSVIRSRQTSADVANLTGASSNTLAPSPVAVPGVAGARGNLPAPPTAAPTQTTVPPSTVGTSRNTETTNYEVSRTTSRTVEPPGDVARVSVAVLIDDSREAKADAEGKMSVTRAPRSPEELQKLFALVSTAVGVDETRGDQVTVQNVPFDEPALEEPPLPPTFWTRYQSPIQEGSRVTSVLVLGLVAIFFVIRPMMRRSVAIAPRLAHAVVGGPVVTSSSGSTPILERPKTVAELENEIEAQMDADAAGKAGDARRLPVLTRRAAAIAQKEPENTAKLLRSWMAE